MLVEKYDLQSPASIFSAQTASTTDQTNGRPSVSRFPRISSGTPSSQNSALNTELLPSMTRPAISMPIIEKPPPSGIENPVGRGPKIYTKNLPDVFTSGSTVTRGKKFAGIRERNKEEDGDQNSLQIGTPVAHGSVKRNQPKMFASPLRPAQVPIIKGKRKGIENFDMNPASMKENIEVFQPNTGKGSPKKTNEFFKEKYGISPPRRSNKIRIRTNIEYGSIFDNNNTGKNEFSTQEEIKKQIKKLIIFKKKAANTSESKFVDENNKEVKLVPIDIISIMNMLTINQPNELITLNKIRSTIRNGAVKRMVHVPSFNLIDVVEESIADIGAKETYDIKSWVNNWKTHFPRSQHVSKIYSCFWNSPEYCVSVVCEPAKNGFLSDLIDSHGSFPEKAIQTIGKELLSGLIEIQTKLSRPYGVLTPREVIIDSEGTLKITPGISSIFPNNFSSQKAELKSPRSNEGSIYKPSVKFQQAQNELKSTSPPEDLSQDIFDFGFCLLQCVLGDFSMYDLNTPITIENLKMVLTTLGSQKRPDMCCLIHSEDIVRKAISGQNSNISTKRRNISKKRAKLMDDLESSFHSEVTYVSLEEALSVNRASDSFTDLLCSCLKIDKEQRPKAEDLLKHKFFSETHQPKGPQVSFKELLNLVSSSKATGNILKSIENENDAALNKFGEYLRVVFLNRHVKDKFDSMLRKNGKNEMDEKVISDLASELGVSSHKLKRKLNECLNDLQDCISESRGIIGTQ